MRAAPPQGSRRSPASSGHAAWRAMPPKAARAPSPAATEPAVSALAGGDRYRFRPPGGEVALRTGTAPFRTAEASLDPAWPGCYLPFEGCSNGSAGVAFGQGGLVLKARAAQTYLQESPGACQTDSCPVVPGASSCRQTRAAHASATCRGAARGERPFRSTTPQRATRLRITHAERHSHPSVQPWPRPRKAATNACTTIPSGDRVHHEPCGRRRGPVRTEPRAGRPPPVAGAVATPRPSIIPPSPVAKHSARASGPRDESSRRRSPSAATNP